MPKTDWTTDPEVLARLKKSPVEWITTSQVTVCGRVDEDGALITERLKDRIWCATSLDPSDADHIQAAWMVELAKGVAEKPLLSLILTPLANEQLSVELGEWGVDIPGIFTWCGFEQWTDWPIHALAEALDWLETQT